MSDEKYWGLVSQVWIAASVIANGADAVFCFLLALLTLLFMVRASKPSRSDV